MEYLKQIKEHIENLELSKVVTLWEEYALSDEINPNELKKILLAIQNSDLRTSFGCYIEEMIPLWTTLPETDEKEEILRLLIDLQTSNSASLREVVIEFLTKKYGNHPDFQQKMRLIGVKERPEFQGAISHFLILDHMKKGNFFLHNGGWGVGEVMDVSYLREEAIFEFDYVAGQKDLSFANAFNTLKPISKDHFLARRFGSPDSFEEFAKKHPVETIHILLRDLGPKTAFEIKEEMCHLVIPEEQWTKWWQNTRAKLKKDPLVVSPTSQSKPFQLLEEGVGPEDRLIESLNKIKTPKKMIELLYTFMRDFPGALRKKEFSQHLIQELKTVLKERVLSPSEELQILFILEDLGESHLESLKHLILKTDAQEIIDHFDIINMKKRLLLLVQKFNDDWPNIFGKILLHVHQNLVKEFIFQHLVAQNHQELFISFFEKILERPALSPHTLMWYFPKVMSSDSLPFADKRGKILLLQAFFNLMYHIENQPKEKDFLKKMHAFLTHKRFQYIRNIFEHATYEDLQEILLLASKCQYLSDHEMKILHSLAEVVDPSIKTMRKKEHQEEQEHIIWTTQEGQSKVKQRIEQIAHVEMLENTKEIEIARSYGDLRENSEFKFAKEKRARLQSELKFLSQQLSHMRILTKNDIDTSQVGIGTIATLVDDEGKEISYVLLGPWDADPENHVLSFQSQLAKDLTNKKIGDTVSIAGKDWMIKKIASYL